MRYAVGAIHVDAETLVVTEGGTPVAVGPRVAATLAVLCERAPEVVSKDELIARTWPDTVVDDSSLWQNVHVIRQLLRTHAGAGGVENVRGRGYRLSVPVTIVENAPAWSLQRAAVAAAAVLFLAFAFGSAPIPQAARSTEAQRVEKLASYYWNIRSASAMRRSLALYERLARLEPNRAEGYAGIAEAAAIYSLFYDDGGRGYLTYRALALRASDKALALNPNSAAAETAYALAREIAEQRYGSADEHYRNAIAIDPDYAPARLRFGISLLLRGKLDDATVQLRRAADLQPVSLPANLWLARALYFSHRADDGLGYAREAVRLAPDQWDAQLTLGEIEVARGDARAARNTFASLRALAPQLAQMMLAQVDARNGARQEARALLAHEKLYASSDSIVWENAAIARLRLDDRAGALSELRHVQNGDATDWSLLALDPGLDSVRNDPRFARWTTLDNAN